MGQVALKQIDEQQFDTLLHFVCDLVSKVSGNVLGEKQKSMVDNRVRRRMLELNIDSPKDYLSFIRQNFADEKEYLVGALTTHHTFFFREFSQIQAVQKHLPHLVDIAKKNGRKELKVWSVACSRGQEVYTLAMFLERHLKEIDPSMSYSVLGTDIDAGSVKIAKNGVYRKQELDRVPLSYLADHWVKGTGKVQDFVKIKKSVREKCDFQISNLMNLSKSLGTFDLLLVRNVLIYFDDKTVKQVASSLYNHMEDGAILVCGASESVEGAVTGLSRKAPSIYAKGSLQPAEEKESSIQPMDPTPKIIADRPLRVVCVDDSKSVLKLLKRILVPEHGFEVVGVAENGLQAKDLIDELRPDAVTLDIHMPEMDGLEYLQSHHSSSHPPVVVVSSASREESSTALRSLILGAKDFVEKPSLANFMQRGEEIRSKLSVAVTEKNETSMSFDVQFAKSMDLQKTKDKAVIICTSAGQVDQIKAYIKQFEDFDFPIFIALEGQDNIVDGLADQISSDFGSSVVALSEENKQDSFEDKVVVGSLSDVFHWVEDHGVASVFNVFNKLSTAAEDQLFSLQKSKWIKKDNGDDELDNRYNYNIPVTSFQYHTIEMLNSLDEDM